ncbi:hypothetical protein [Sandaracinus amylolyticus]|uniref:Uncharacterized protein n=1 Tax=Sandaracinus amylolyticus TaxID=927083 RepID=A0A0F6YHT1_9BACT|nr:hypothetical protein [Sandaracinus amylolyticus]AKF05451.1 hypothetical protein DB32_002600 [Sandaracinus amylolyticus]
MTGGDDAGTPDSGPPPAALTGDWSCVGSRTAPTPGAASTFTAHVYDFQSGMSSNVGGVAVDYFPDNVVAEGCSGTCVRTTPGADGNVAGLMGMENAWFAYRVAAGTGSGGTTPVLTVGYNRAVPANGGTTQLPSVSSMTIGFIPTLYMRSRLPGTAIVSGTLTDCAGAPAANAQVRIFRGGTELVTGPGSTDFFSGYFNAANLPDSNRTATNTNGLFAAANAEATDEPLRVELWGVRTEGMPAERVACEEIEVFADAVTIVNVGPLRNDYASGSGCGG